MIAAGLAGQDPLNLLHHPDLQPSHRSHLSIILLYFIILILAMLHFTVTVFMLFIGLPRSSD